ncbi:hypothetical protein AALB39_27740 [Lachnospiraceae bacterium 54-53]
MFFILKSWFQDPGKEEEVYRLFNEYFPNTCVLSVDEIEKQKEFPNKLKELGELEILKHYENGEIVMNG